MAVLARKSSFQSIGRDERGVTTRTRAGPGFDVGTDGDEIDGDISGRTLCVMDVRAASGGPQLMVGAVCCSGWSKILSAFKRPQKLDQIQCLFS